jgi:NitT/TauT family transport system substrate-binding protein
MSKLFISSLRVLGRKGLVLVLSAVVSAPGWALDKVVFGTNWFAQAEHGGFYQAVADGTYERYGLDVEIKMGGPQVNGMQLLAAGALDVAMGFPIRNMHAVNEGLPVVTVAGFFQKDPQVLLTHPHIESLEAIKGRPVLISNDAHVTYWPWLEVTYGFTKEMIRPYTFSVQPFLNDKDTVQQGYVSSEPFAIEQGGVKPNIFLFADYGYPPYSATLEVTRKTLAERGDVIRRFIEASAIGWKSYLENPAAGNALIQEHNPEMTDEQIAYGISKMKEYELVTGGDAKEKGIGTMSDERWQKTFDFLVEAELIDEDFDYRQVYTLDYLPKKPIK